MLFLTVSSNEKETFDKTKTKIHSEYIKSQSNTLIVTQSTLYGLCRIKDEFTGRQQLLNINAVSTYHMLAVNGLKPEMQIGICQKEEKQVEKIQIVLS